jgi:hypothetical protein
MINKVVTRLHFRCLNFAEYCLCTVLVPFNKFGRLIVYRLGSLYLFFFLMLLWCYSNVFIVVGWLKKLCRSKRCCLFSVPFWLSW